MPFRMGRGDYMPGYYQGDPGIVDFIKSRVLPIAGKLLGTVTGPTGAVIQGLTARHALQARGVALPAPYVPGPVGMIPGSGRAVDLLTGGSPGGSGTLAARAGAPPMIPTMLGAGHLGRVPRPSGKGFYTKRHLAALARGLSRAKPRMNPFNPSALRRAARRAHTFLRMSRRLVAYYTPKQHKGKAYIKARRKR